MDILDHENFTRKIKTQELYNTKISRSMVWSTIVYSRKLFPAATAISRRQRNAESTAAPTTQSTTGPFPYSGSPFLVLQQGKDGRDGVNGRDGRDGLPGKSGEKGDPGVQGPPGSTGRRG